MMNVLINGQIIPIDDIIISHNIFVDNLNIINVDLNYCSCENNSIINLFQNCYNLTTVTNINENVTNMYYAFGNCTNLVNAPAIPNSIIDMSYVFSNCTNLVNAPVIPNSVSNMAYTFSICNHLVNATVIPNNVTDMNHTFYNCTNLRNVSEIPNSVTNMNSTFYFCANISNAPVIPNSVTNLYETFAGCHNISNAPVIPNSVTSMYQTFYSCTRLINAPEIPNSVINMYGAFSSCHNLVNAPEIPNSVIDMRRTFCFCINLVNAPVIPTSVTSITEAFSHCYNLINVPEIPSSVTNMAYTFSHCYNLINVPEIPSSVTNMAYTFTNCYNLINAPDMSNATHVTDMTNTFYNCRNLVNAPEIPNSVIYMNYTFANCSNLVNAPVIPNSVTNMWYTFVNCYNLVNAPKIYVRGNYITGAFQNCYNLVNAPIIPSSVNIMARTFYGCQKLRGKILISSQNIGDVQNCFNGTSLTKSVFIPFTYANNVRTKTYNYFSSMYVSGQNGVTLYDIKRYNSSFPDWLYDTLENETKLLYRYIGTNDNVIVPDNTILNKYSIPVSNVPFYNYRGINNVDLNNIPFVDNDMSNAFYNCANLISVTNINENVTNMSSTFDYCTNLTGDIIIQSENIINCRNCFNNTSLDKNVYISFQNNGEYTTTYNSFISAGYSEYYRVNGAKLFDPNSFYINFNITPDVNTLKYLNGHLVVNNSQETSFRSEYVLYNENYPIVVGHVAKLDPQQEYTLTKDLTSVIGNTITLNVDQSGCDVIFNINGVEISATVNGNLYTLTLNTDEEISVGYHIEKDGYSTLIGSITFNNGNVTENITMEAAIWTTWTRPNLTEDGTLGESSTAVSATRYSSQYAYYAMDSSTSTYWRSSSTGTVTYTIYNPKKLKITQTVFTYSGTYYRATSVTVQGSNDNTNWEDITSSYSGTTTGTLDMSSNTKGYKYYKFSLVAYSSAIRLTDITFTAQELQN